MVSTPALARTHVDAVVTLLRTGGVKTYLSEAPAEPHTQAPFVVLWPDPGAVAAGSLGDWLSDLVVTVQTTSVVGTAEQALWLADKVARLLWAATPTIPGRTTLPVRGVDTQPVQRDDSLAVPLFYAVAVWRLHTTP